MNIVQLTWEQTVPVRQEVLWPGMPEDFCYVVGDEQAQHYGVEIDGELVTVASVFIDEDEETARIRKFATLLEHRHEGLGSALLEHILSDVQRFNVHYFWCISRESTVDFYKRLGLHIEDDRFSKCGISFYRMSCQLGESIPHAPHDAPLHS